LLIPKVRTLLGAAILIAATTVSTIVVSKWNLFPPKDYEECAARAAKDAKSKDGLSVLLSICASDFKGRRKAGGGYAYYDSCQHRTFDIKGPNPTPDEVHYVKLQCLNYLDAEARAAAEEAEAERKAQQAAQEAREMRQQAEREARVEATRRLRDRKIWAIRDIHVTPAFDCRGSLTFCSKKFKVTNGSNEALSGVLIGLAFAPTTNAACPQPMLNNICSKSKFLPVRLATAVSSEQLMRHSQGFALVSKSLMFSLLATSTPSVLVIKC
jgi:hypothetical protein